MKGALALSLCLAVVAAFCDAPFVHFHSDGHSEHAKQAHQGTGFGDHTHRARAETRPDHGAIDVAATDGSDEDAFFLAWFQSGPQAKPTVVPSLPVLAAVVDPAIVVVASVASPTPRSHDPPGHSDLRPRSPPPSDSLLAV